MWGQSARIIESEVTSKLESMLNRMKGIKNIESHSGNGNGSITVHLSEHTDPDIARFEISTIIRQAWPSLPNGVSYPSVQMSGTSEEVNYPFLQYTINAPYSPIEIQEYIDKNLRPKLSEIKGIEKVEVNGASKYIYKLEYDYFQLQKHDISINEIRKAINSYLNKDFLGIGKRYKIEDGEEESIRINLLSKYPELEFDPKNIQVINKKGKIVYLNQLVSCSYVEEEASSFFRINGLNSIYLLITADNKSNQLTLRKSVQQLLKNIKKDLPIGYELHLTYDEGEYIKGELNKLYIRSGFTILILLLFIFIVYRNIKHSLVIIISLTTTISIAVILYHILNVEIHLFTLAGLTISLNLIIDNIIIMSDQIVLQKNKKSFMPIFAATITTIGSLSVIFFMDESIQLKLYDFAILIIINLTLSLIVSITLVPALIEKFRLIKTNSNNFANKRINKSIFKINYKRIIAYFNHIYITIIHFSSKKKIKKIIIVSALLIFGLPVFLLPEKIGDYPSHSSYSNKNIEEKSWEVFYNRTLGSFFYKEHIKPVIDIALGGTMRLFVQKVKNGAYDDNKKSETTLNVTASLPNGSTKEQMDVLMREMERYISQYKEIRQFETLIQNGRKANIKILLKKDFQKGAFPHLLYSKLISKANELGGGSWSVYGLGDGFNNEIKEQAGSSRIKLLGYNYDQLTNLANTMRDSLLKHKRIKEVTIDSEFSRYKSDYMEYIFELKKDKLAEANILPIHLFNILSPIVQQNSYAATWTTNKKAIPINLYSKQNKELDIWNINNFSGEIGNNGFRLNKLANITKAQVPQNIAKENQQYKLCLQYEYIGNYQQAYNVRNQQIDRFNQNAPLGYKAEGDSYRYWWEKAGSSQYWLLLLIIAILFVTTSVLFNSFKQPFIIIFIIPISFIGIFLSFYLFELNFDQGGFAAFILLSGLTINANIYILNEYNNIRKTNKNILPIRAYLKAWNNKIRPIFLTILSTILGFIPFVIGEFKEAFWFPLAIGTIGGLIISFIALFLFLPLFMNLHKTDL